MIAGLIIAAVLTNALTREPLAHPPYLVSPPAVIDIDLGRQLFVDDFLIESNTLTRVHHRPEYYAGNPILKPDQPWEITPHRKRAGLFSDGVWFDSKDQLFKMWYWAGESATALATSKDGIRWEKPKFDVVRDTNIVLRDEEGVQRNSSTVWLDSAEKDPARRFKMFRVVQNKDGNRLRISFSPDGSHWTNQADTDSCGDRTTVFFNPFRNVWVFSLRDGNLEVGRARSYFESPQAIPSSWKTAKRLWIGADKLDPSRSDLKLRQGKWELVPSQLYNLDCVAYESVLLGLFSIWRGQPVDRPKINEVCVGFSRDGLNWTRPDRRAFCPVSENKDDWNWGNVQSAGGCCLVVGDKLHFYVGGVSGKSGYGPDPCQVGLATLRRDGFTSLDGPGTLTTRRLKFSGKYLFANFAGEMRVEVLDAGITSTVSGDSTRQKVVDVSKFAGKPVQFRFHVQRGSLYSFWVSPNESGASRGYVAAGGPGLPGPLDED